jgi:hypothetical protein
MMRRLARFIVRPLVLSPALVPPLARVVLERRVLNRAPNHAMGIGTRARRSASFSPSERNVPDQNNTGRKERRVAPKLRTVVAALSPSGPPIRCRDRPATPESGNQRTWAGRRAWVRPGINSRPLKIAWTIAESRRDQCPSPRGSGDAYMAAVHRFTTSMNRSRHSSPIQDARTYTGRLQHR